jgi:hypothetical protein
MPHFYIVKTDEEIKGIHLVYREAKELYDNITQPNTQLERFNINLANGRVLEKTLLISRS